MEQFWMLFELLFLMQIQTIFFEKVYFRSQILERPSIGKYWNISAVPVLPENVIFTFFRTCWWHPETNNTGMPKWSSIAQYLCTSIWDLKFTFSFFFFFPFFCDFNKNHQSFRNWQKLVIYKKTGTEKDIHS